MEASRAWPRSGRGCPTTQAAALHITYQTGHVGLHRRAHLQAGETLLVHAGAGGVGSAAIQLGRPPARGSSPTAGGPEKVQVCRELGADLVVDYRARRLRRAGQGGHRRPRRRRRLRPGRRRHLRPVDASASRSRAGSSSSGSPAAVRRGPHQPRADQELLRRRPALGPLPAARPRRLRVGARGADPPVRGRPDRSAVSRVLPLEEAPSALGALASRGRSARSC